MPQGALQGVKVLDLTHHIAGPYCTKLLAGLGAEVIKVERPGRGDPARSIGPFLHDGPHLETSALFLYLNTGKKSITLNLKSPTGVSILKELVVEADVLVENFAPRVMPSLGLSYEGLEKLNPRLVMTSISNFGQTGPYRDYKASEIAEYALSGLMSITGEPDREPLKTGGSIAQYVAGQTALVGTLTALLYAEASEVGQHVDISILEANIAIAEFNHVLYSYSGVIDERKGNRHGNNHPWGIYPCKDGWVGVIGGPARAWPEMVKWIDERLADPRFATMYQRTRPDARDEIDAIILPWLLEHTKEEIYHGGQARGLGFGYVATTEDLLNSPHLQSRTYFVDVDHPVAGSLKYPGAPFCFAETPWQMGRAPLLGEHNEAIYCGQLGYNKEDVVKLTELGIV